MPLQGHEHVGASSATAGCISRQIPVSLHPSPMGKKIKPYVGRGSPSEAGNPRPHNSRHSARSSRHIHTGHIPPSRIQSTQIWTSDNGVASTPLAPAGGDRGLCRHWLLWAAALLQAGCVVRRRAASSCRLHSSGSRTLPSSFRWRNETRQRRNRCCHFDGAFDHLVAGWENGTFAMRRRRNTPHCPSTKSPPQCILVLRNRPLASPSLLGITWWFPSSEAPAGGVVETNTPKGPGSSV